MATSQPRRQSHCLPIGVSYASAVLLRGWGAAKGKTQTKLKLREQVTTGALTRKFWLENEMIHTVPFETFLKL